VTTGSRRRPLAGRLQAESCFAYGDGSPDPCGPSCADPTLFNQLSVPTPLTPVPPPPEHGFGSYPEDQEHEDDEKFVDSSLSIDQVVAWIADEALGEMVDLSGDEDEGIDGFCHEESHGPVRALEPFNARVSTSYWPRWDECSTGM
jgi:hypothetical protein